MSKFRFVFVLQILATIALAVPAQAQYYKRFAPRMNERGQISYYGETFYKEVSAGLRNDDLRRTLHTLLSSGHIPRPGQFDEIVNRCDGRGGQTCFFHRPLSYNQARTYLFGRLYLEQRGGTYYIDEVYCQKPFSGHGIGPDRIPDDKFMNAEHTWPQSRFTSRYPKDIQKSDLHHLFPTNSQMNASRGNFEFAEVGNGRPLVCPTSSMGQIKNRWFFEPPDQHKGNVARALFYFAVRYEIEISPIEETFLRKWNQEDPPDEAEVRRNQGIYEVQGNRNPFVDHPEMVEMIANF